MRRVVLTAFAIASSAAIVAATAAAARADSLCVGRGTDCFAKIQPAIDAAHDGDVIHVRRGSFPGGITIDKSLTLVGARAGATTIRGGGPVLTIGVLGAVTEPTVAIRRVRLTGGLTRSSAHCGPTCATDFERATALGGGIEIPPAAEDATGATVTISDSVIAGNRVDPAKTVPSVRSICPSGPCRFALAGGGGIDNWGVLTLKNTRVADNRVGGALNSEADGRRHPRGGNGTADAREQRRGRQPCRSPPRRTAASRKAAASSWPAARSRSAAARWPTTSPRSTRRCRTTWASRRTRAGIHLTDQASATIAGARINGNRLSMTNSVGDATAFSAGLHADGPLVLRDSSVSGNAVTATTTAPSPAGAFADSGAGELNVDATISGTQFEPQQRHGDGSGGTAARGAAPMVTAAFGAMTITDSTVIGNRLTATTTTGSSTVQGGGLANIGVLTLRNTSVSDNRGTAIGPTGSASRRRHLERLGPRRPASHSTRARRQRGHTQHPHGKPRRHGAGRRPLHPVSAYADEQRHRTQRAGPVLWLLTRPAATEWRPLGTRLNARNDDPSEGLEPATPS